MMHMTQHYNHEKYWKMHNEVINSNSKKNILVRYFYLFRVKRSDAVSYTHLDVYKRQVRRMWI